ncbi:MAG: type I restriction-modification system subunit M N-terminal domain-containing protein [Thermoguttaceae bacterium]
MSTDTQDIVNKAWNFAHVLRDDGLSYMVYTEQITFLLFLKMADERTRPPYKLKTMDYGARWRHNWFCEGANDAGAVCVNISESLS